MISSLGGRPVPIFVGVRRTFPQNEVTVCRWGTRLLWVGILLVVLVGCRPPQDTTYDASAHSISDALPASSREHGATTQKRPQGSGKDWFEEVTAETGVAFSYSNGRSAGEYAILESLGGGVAAFDYDLDGHIDLLFPGGGRLDQKTVSANRCGLYRNLGDWRFVETTDRAGCAADRYYNHGVYAADYDNDGFPDLAVSGYGGLQLLHNQGDGTFEFVQSLITHPTNAWSTSLAWADLDNDGDLDLYVAHYVDWSWKNHPLCPGPQGVPREVCAPRVFAGLSDAIYLNDGQGGFRRVAEEVGLAAGGKGLGVVVGDTNADGYVDIYVGNDTTDNYLYINDGTAHFTESAVLAGVAGDQVGVSMGTMGVDLADVTGDGMPDIWATGFERELFALYQNEGNGYFSHISHRAGIAAFEGLYVGFGTCVVDFDQDGYRDILTANGHVSYHSPGVEYRQLPLLLKNAGNGRWERWPHGGYFEQKHTGRGLAYADLDDNGSWDLIFSHAEEPVALLRAQTPPQPRWVHIRLIGTASNRDAIGTTLRMTTGDTVKLYMRNGGGSYLSTSDPRIQILIPEGGPDTPVQIRWASGKEERRSLPSPGTEAVWIEGRSHKTP